MIELVQLTKRYDKNEKLALDHIDYFTNQTCPLGIVGSNGAGKSTMFMLANGLARPTSGSVRLLGKDLAENKSIIKRTGLFTDRLMLYPILTVKETICYFMGIYGISKKEYENRIKMFYIDEFENSKIDSLSTGMLKRVMLLISMLHMPDILFLDEPFSGLDMDAKNELSEAIQYLYREKNIKIVISSHDLFETQDLIEDVMILEAGRIIEAGKYDDLIRKYSKVKKLRVVCEDDAVILGSYSKLVRKREAGQMELCMGIEEFYSFLEGVDRRKVINIINNDMSLGDIYEEARKHANISNGEKGD
jgi:ABC-type multidrug transport system, ATPase component